MSFVSMTVARDIKSGFIMQAPPGSLWYLFKLLEACFGPQDCKHIKPLHVGRCCFWAYIVNMVAPTVPRVPARFARALHWNDAASFAYK
ncbi:hypothetical protein B0H11DRAFT_2273263 [Mycena galericulata]|nr:hypothetical protein B0H11DRAFT_2296308 [Mycena galericulata]KAJ7504675.1 hypothetical protein B0H11DRAFT_2273263 [Mycena galericulata]